MLVPTRVLANSPTGSHTIPAQSFSFVAIPIKRWFSRPVDRKVAMSSMLLLNAVQTDDVPKLRSLLDEVEKADVDVFKSILVQTCCEYVSFSSSPQHGLRGGTSLLHWASHQGSLPALTALLERGSVVKDMINSGDDEGATPVHWVSDVS